MANKYSSWDKYMLTFTVPSNVKGKTIKNGRYTKLRELIRIRAYIAKLLNNTKDVKYFMNIELGKKFSNPHLHLQLYFKDSAIAATSANTIRLKTISKFNLNKNRCHLTEPQHDIPVYDYVIKDYAKDLSDDDLWNLETQKKRMRLQLGKRVRFVSKSTDRFTKKIYRIMYYSYGVVRDLVEESVDFFIRNFFYFSKKRGIKFSSFCFSFSTLGYKEQEGNVLYESVVLYIVVFRFAPTLDPPVFVLYFTLQAKIYLKGKFMKKVIKFLSSYYVTYFLVGVILYPIGVLFWLMALPYDAITGEFEVVRDWKMALIPSHMSYSYWKRYFN